MSHITKNKVERNQEKREKKRWKEIVSQQEREKIEIKRGRIN